MKALIGLVFMISLASACTTERQFENYGITSAAELQLTPENHARGYGNRECYSCHVHSNIHRVDRFDPALTELARQLTQNNEVTSCRGCHGPNGVTE